MVQISRSDFTLNNLWCVYLGTDIRFFNSVVKRHAESAQKYGTVTRYQGVVTMYQVFGSMYQVFGTMYQVFGTEYQVFST